jgi:branched-chain amino acid transport system substrate-binding protein
MRLRIILLLLILTQTATAGPLTLGVSLPLSGNGAGWGVDVRNTLTFANEKLGDGSVRLIFEDDRCEPKGAVTAAQKLTAIDKVNQVYVMCGQSVLAAAPIYQRAGVTVLTMGTPSKLSRLGVFRMSLSDAVGAAFLVHAIKERYRAITVLTEEADYPTELWRDFEIAADSIGLKTQNELFQPQQYDFRSLLLRIKQSGSDVLFLNTQSEQSLTALLKQLRELGMSPTLYAAYIPGSAGFLASAGPLADGIIFLDFPGAAELLNEEGQRMYGEYQSKFGPIKGWSFTFPGVFEAFRLVRDSSSSGVTLADYLRSGTFQGIFGAYSFDMRGDLKGPRHVLRTIRNRAIEVLR